jgi:broad specificity phosphatase PhoE
MQGQLDVPLDEVGRQQAAAVAGVLGEAAPSALLSSDLARARDTGQALADATGVRLRLDARLRELDLGHWQGLTIDEAKQRYPTEYDAWRAGDDVPRGGGETYRQASYSVG